MLNCRDGFTASNVIFTAIGASILWAKAGRSNLRPFLFAEVLGALSLPVRFRRFLEFAVFVGLGCAVGIAVVGPVNAGQALTAGLVWTGIFVLPDWYKAST
jgi:hypothetical protein